MDILKKYIFHGSCTDFDLILGAFGLCQHAPTPQGAPEPQLTQDPTVYSSKGGVDCVVISGSHTLRTLDLHLS